MSQSTQDKTVVIIAGPTAVGKTAVAIEVARHFDTEIISADSRQCFKELNIGVARPSEGELKLVPHHFVASHSIREEVTAAAFETFALQKTAELFTKHHIVVMTGGTGLYIKAFTEGLDQIPPVAAEVRNDIIERFNSSGIAWLQEEIQRKDPRFFESGEIHNPQRLMRALEVYETTGRSIVDFRKGEKKVRPFRILKIGLTLPKAALDARINKRVDQMVEQGLVDEVKSLLPYRNINALQTVGYAEIFDYLDNRIGLTQAIEEIKLHTRQYAKRQMTWFKKDQEVRWFPQADISDIIAFISDEARRYKLFPGA